MPNCPNFLAFDDGDISQVDGSAIALSVGDTCAEAVDLAVSAFGVVEFDGASDLAATVRCVDAIDADVLVMMLVMLH